MPNRIIKEAICTSPDIDALTDFQEAFYYRLIVNCDDYGRFDGREQVIKARLYPLKDISTKTITATLDKFESLDMVRRYTYEGRPYIHIVAWESHQQVRAQRSKYPNPKEADVTNNCKTDDQENSCDINGYQRNSDVPVIQSNPIRNRNRNPIQSCAEPLQDTAPEEEEEDTTPVVKQIELKNGSLYDVTQGYVNELKRAYPDVNVVAELNRMVAWTDANPTKRKTERGIKRFITTWLGRAQDDAKKQGRSRPRAMPSIDDYKSDIDAVTIMRRMEQDKREAANG